MFSRKIAISSRSLEVRFDPLPDQLHVAELGKANEEPDEILLEWINVDAADKFDI